MEYSDNIYAKAAELIRTADAVLVSASNGLSIAEGYHIFADDVDFRKYFGTFRKKYGIDCLIRGIFTPMTEADHNTYMQKVHQYLIDDYKGSSVMKNLLEILRGKRYFVVTSNGDTHFQMNGFDPDRIFEVEGNFDGLHEQDQSWQAQAERFQNFIHTLQRKSLLVLELGIGSGNQLIKAPLMKMVQENVSWHYVTLNMPDEIYVPSEIADRSLAVAGNIAETFAGILAELNSSDSK